MVAGLGVPIFRVITVFLAHFQKCRELLVVLVWVLASHFTVLQLSIPFFFSLSDETLNQGSLSI